MGTEEGSDILELRLRVPNVMILYERVKHRTGIYECFSTIIVPS